MKKIIYSLAFILIAGIIFLASIVIFIYQKPEYRAVRQGVANIDSGKYQQAIKDFNQAIKINPNFVPAYEGRAQAYYESGEYKQAIENHKKCINLDPNNAVVYNNFAWILATCPDHKYRDVNRAVELAEKASELKEEAYIIDTLAAAYARANRMKDAVRAQERAIELLIKQGKMKELSEHRYGERLKRYRTGEPWVE